MIFDLTLRRRSLLTLVRTESGLAVPGTIATASAVYFLGGGNNRLSERYGGTRFEAEPWKVHRRGGVVGGGSAGAMVLGSYQANRPVPKATRSSIVRRILKTHPDLRAIGVDEGTAAVVQSNGTIAVVDRGTVTFFQSGICSSSTGFYASVLRATTKRVVAISLSDRDAALPGTSGLRL
jgi:cyanophycinase-like exopeptidase